LVLVVLVAQLVQMMVMDTSESTLFLQPLHLLAVVLVEGIQPIVEPIRLAVMVVQEVVVGITVARTQLL
jgi:hypothetical protein